MFIGMACGFAIIPELDYHFLYLLVAGGLLVLVGVADDKFQVRAGIRLLTHLSAVLIMVLGGGLLLHDIGNPLGGGTINLGPAALIGTFLVTLTVINAFNFVDGVDGLAGCLALTALAAIAIVGGSDTPATAVAPRPSRSPWRS